MGEPVTFDCNLFEVSNGHSLQDRVTKGHQST
ncbi:unnamed protein product [Gulo gulo]|uniref:Uncharacterized protein n=1 Tax=Gulo gulo TaxID=48420 RepID=A0A9X9Q8B1_GULGU|nr:unnamed protein product [Gulo gulo]